MNETLDFKTSINSSRGRVYLLWGAIVAVGFVWTHYYQNPNINITWTILSIIGFGYMYKVMPLRVEQMRKIYMAWLIPIVIGMIWSVIAARTSLLPDLLGYLGPFWLLVMAAGYIWNGLVDAPGFWYYVVGAVNIVAAVIIDVNANLLAIQYLLIAVISLWSMLILWSFRGDT